MQGSFLPQLGTSAVVYSSEEKKWVELNYIAGVGTEQWSIADTLPAFLPTTAPFETATA